MTLKSNPKAKQTPVAALITAAAPKPLAATPQQTPVAALVTASTPKQLAVIPSSTFDAMPDSGYVREAQLVPSPKRPGIAVPLPFSAPTLWRKVREGTFCKPYKLSSRVTAFKVGEVRAWLAAQEAMSYNPVVVGKNPVKRTALVTG